MTEDTPEVKPKRKRQKKGDTHYVNNKEFTLALDTWSRECKLAIAEEREKPQMTNYIADCIMKMSFRLSLTPRFSGYTYRDEMVNNGVLAAVKYAWRFDGDRFDNGFAYITQILFSHFVLTIKKEKKLYETNLRYIQEIEAENFDNLDFKVNEETAKAIADQKLQQMEERSESQEGVQKGFILRTGKNAAERAAYKGGTPVDRSGDDEGDDE